jgi:16S rRNA (adenine1518-N6/adenine1519-N6)-dimethyltransferase
MLPKKSLGQNFLTSIPARIAIVEAGNLTSTDTVLEIGPGKGFLTRALLDTGATVFALEKDRDLLPILSETFSTELASKKLILIEGDALTFLPQDTIKGKYKLIANIPYYITGAILSRYLSSSHQPETMVVLVQKEVAERTCARDGKESLLSLSVKVYGDPKLVYRVSRGSFNPIPSVDSGVLQIQNISRKSFKNQYHEDMFFKVIKAGFAHKRKFVISNLKEKIPTTNWLEVFTKNNINEKARAEDIALGTWLAISAL